MQTLSYVLAARRQRIRTSNTAQLRSVLAVGVRHTAAHCAVRRFFSHSSPLAPCQMLSQAYRWLYGAVGLVDSSPSLAHCSLCAKPWRAPSVADTRNAVFYWWLVRTPEGVVLVDSQRNLLLLSHLPLSQISPLALFPMGHSGLLDRDGWPACKPCIGLLAHTLTLQRRELISRRARAGPGLYSFEILNEWQLLYDFLSSLHLTPVLNIIAVYLGTRCPFVDTMYIRWY